MTTIQKKSVLGQDNPIAHLTEADIEQIGIELDAIRQEVLDTRGELGGELLLQQRIELIRIGDDADVGGVALVS